MSAAWLWTRVDLRARWRSWLVLGLLAGATVGLAAGAIAVAVLGANALAAGPARAAVRIRPAEALRVE